MANKTKDKLPLAKPDMTTTELRALVKQLVEAELDEAKALLEQCKLEKRAALLARLGGMIMPRLAAGDVPKEGDEWFILDLDSEREEPEYPSEKEIAIAAANAEKKRPGRPPKSLNKKTIQIRDKLKIIFAWEYNYITRHLHELRPEKRLAMLFKLAPLVMPVQTAKEVELDEEGEKVTNTLMFAAGKAIV